MSKKDLTQINTGRVYDTIAEATAQETRKERKTYNEQEAAEILESGKTSGRKGLKIPRMNLGLTPSNAEYIQTMARATGQNMTDFVNGIIKQHRDEHGELYRQVIEFRNKL